MPTQRASSSVTLAAAVATLFASFGAAGCDMSSLLEDASFELGGQTTGQEGRASFRLRHCNGLTCEVKEPFMTGHVNGLQIRIDDPATPCNAFEVTSANPAVLEVGAAESPEECVVVVPVRAAAAGQTAVYLRRAGEVVDVLGVEVATMTTIDYAFTFLEVDGDTGERTLVMPEGGDAYVSAILRDASGRTLIGPGEVTWTVENDGQVMIDTTTDVERAFNVLHVVATSPGTARLEATAGPLQVGFAAVVEPEPGTTASGEEVN